MNTMGRRRLDYSSLALAVVGIVCGVIAYVQIENHGYNALILVPSVVAATVGLTHLVKREASHSFQQSDPPRPITVHIGRGGGGARFDPTGNAHP